MIAVRAKIAEVMADLVHCFHAPVVAVAVVVPPRAFAGTVVVAVVAVAGAADAVGKLGDVHAADNANLVVVLAETHRTIDVAVQSSE